MTIDIDEAKVERNELGLWLGWTLAIAGGMLIGFLPTILLVNVLNLGLAQIVVPVFAGTLVGVAQWIALRRFLAATSDWILAGGNSSSSGLDHRQRDRLGSRILGEPGCSTIVL